MIAKIVKTILLVTVITVVAAGCTRTQKEKVVIKGSTTVLPIAQKAQEAFLVLNSNVTVSLSGTGSGDGIKSIIEGSCDIANASRDIKEKEINAAKAAGKNIKGITVALDMLSPVVHPANPVSDLSREQLKAIYKGEITNWKELGGNDVEIVIISRDTSSGTYEEWERMIMGGDQVSSAALLQASNGAVANAVAQNEKAIGYVGLGYLNDTLKALSVEGIAPTDKAFPISRKLFMFINADEIKPAAQKYIDLVLSDQGQKLVSEAGFVPVN